MQLILTSTMSQVLLDDAGVLVNPAPGSNFSSNSGLQRALAKSKDLRTRVLAGTVVVNDGSTDLPPAEGLAYLNQLWLQAGFDTAAQFTQIEGTITDLQHGNRGSGALHLEATPLLAGFMSPGDKGKVDDLYGIRAEDAEMIPIPEGPVQGQGQRITQTTFEGASYVIRRRVIFNRMRIRFNAVPGNGDFVIAIYQEQDGRSGQAALVASAVFAATAAGAFDIPVSEGTVQLVPGLCYVLFGRRTGTQQLSVYSKPTIALLCDPAFSAPNLHPTNFRTGISTAAFPPVFNPLPAPGGDTTATTTDVTPQIRLWKV